jgi:hypothetical protein
MRRKFGHIEGDRPPKRKSLEMAKLPDVDFLTMLEQHMHLEQRSLVGLPGITLAGGTKRQ